MNLVAQILNGIPDDELKEALAEMKELDDKGVLPQGRVRDLALRLQAEVGLSGNDARAIAQASVLRIAAYRWASL